MTGNGPIDLGDILMLVVDSLPPVRLRRADGGGVKSNTVEGPLGTRIKHTPRLALEALVLEMGPNLPVTKWIAAALQKQYDRRHVALYRGKSDGTAEFVLESSDCVVSQVILPGLDRRAKTEAFMTVAIEAERRSTRSLSEHKDQWPQKPLKGFNGAQFDFELGGVPLPGAAVLAIEPISIDFGIKRHHQGNARFGELEAGKLKQSIVTLTVQSKHLAELGKWTDTYLKQATPARPVSGSITYKVGTSNAMELQLYGATPYELKPGRGRGAARLALAVDEMKIDLFGSKFE